MPASRGSCEHAGVRHDERRGAFRRIKKPSIGGGVFGAERIAAGGWEEAIDFTPSEEHEASQNHEQNRVLAVNAERVNADALDAEGKKHGVFAANLIGDPAEERPR